MNLEEQFETLRTKDTKLIDKCLGKLGRALFEQNELYWRYLYRVESIKKYRFATTSSTELKELIKETKELIEYDFAQLYDISPGSKVTDPLKIQYLTSIIQLIKQ